MKEARMDLLQHERCVACRRDSPRVTDAEISELKHQIPEWSVVDWAGIPVLERTYRFPDFTTALTFTQRIGTLAEQEGHRPALLTEYGRVTVSC